MANTRELKRWFEGRKRGNELPRFYQEFQECLDKKDIKPYEIGVREQWDIFVEDGASIRESWNPKYGGGINLRETAVNSADFASINGQITYSYLLEKYEDEVFIGDQLVTTISTEFNGEKIAGITGIGDDSSIVTEADPFPNVGISEQYVETPATDKRGMIIPVTKEAIFFDRTGLILERAGSVGEAMGYSKEKRILSTALGVTNTYRRNGVAVTSYGNVAAPHDWDNLAASNALQDWTDVDAALQLFYAITDPDTGEPINVRPKQIVIPPALDDTLFRIQSATEVRATTNTSNVTLGPKPNATYQHLQNQYVKTTTSSDSTWFIGDFKKAFAYMENWPMTFDTAISGSEAEFTRDIVLQHKASERGVVAVLDPRYVVKCTG